MNIFRGLARVLWGNITREEVRRFGLLSLISFSFITTYSVLRPLKEILFMRFVGTFYLPSAKIASFLVMIPLTLFYSQLVDRIEKYQLFYVFCTLYGFFFIAIAYLLSHETHGLATAGTSPYGILGWAVYIGIESFVMIMLALFWSFVASSTKTESAQRCYPLIMAVSQIGSIAGPELVKQATTLGIPALIGGAGLSMFVIIGIIKAFVVYNPEVIKIEKSTRPTGPIEGLRLIATRPYLLAFISTTALYTMVSGILEYLMMHSIEENFKTLEEMAAFTATLVQTTNFVALFFAVIGSSFFIRNFGVRSCMVAFPLLACGMITLVWCSPTLWVLFAAIVTLKSLSYALNTPSKETLYIPTSLDIKFKAKSWIDGVGYRGFYAVGASVNSFFSSAASLMLCGPLIAMGMCGAWAGIAWYLGTKNMQLIADKKIID
jgi:AAA family ATP:ADP antiporter